MKTTSIANETSVQTAVFSLELGRGKRVVRWVLVVLLAIAVGLIYSARTFRGLNKIEAQDMAQLARHLARGEGYTTYAIRPLSLWQLEENRKCLDPVTHEPVIDNHPDLWNPPAYPWVLSQLFRLTPGKWFELGGTMLDRVLPVE